MEANRYKEWVLPRWHSQVTQKAHFFAKGRTQQDSIDLLETFSPVTNQCHQAHSFAHCLYIGTCFSLMSIAQSSMEIWRRYFRDSMGGMHFHKRVKKKKLSTSSKNLVMDNDKPQGSGIPKFMIIGEFCLWLLAWYKIHDPFVLEIEATKAFLCTKLSLWIWETLHQFLGLKIACLHQGIVLPQKNYPLLLLKDARSLEKKIKLHA